MKKTILYMVLAMLCLFLKVDGQVKSLTIKGKVTSERNIPISGTTISVKGTSIKTLVTVNGYFEVNKVPNNAVILITSVGYQSKEIQIHGNPDLGNIVLIEDTHQLKELEIVSTGYQKLSKERTTGSFEQINNEIINRRVGTNIVERLDGNSSILFDKRDSQFGNRMQLRGLFSLMLETSRPLIVIDNFPYDGDINDLNPNDVENITLLKDANASSIWGTRSGNGVIVITTKKGRFNQPMRINFGVNVTIGAKPDLFKIPVISPSEFIDLEIELFGKGFYHDQLNDPYHSPVSQVVEILNRRTLNQISSADSAQQIDKLRTQDVRHDFDRYIYRKSLNQQYNIDLSGGSNQINYRFSAGYDKNLAGLRGNDFERKTIRSTQHIRLDKKLSLQTEIAYTLTGANSNSTGDYFGASYKTGTGYNLSPYARLADEKGSALPVSRQYLMSYLDTLGNDKLLDWQYRPLDEIRFANNKTGSQTILADIGLRYQVIKGLDADLKYQYQRITSTQENLYNMDSFYARDLINNYTNLNAADISEKYPVPFGGILDRLKSVTDVNNLRMQFNFERTWNSKHVLNVMAGAELRDNHQYTDQIRIYGYNDRLNVTPVNYLTQYPTYQGFNAQVPGQQNTFTDFTHRYISAFANGSYTYNERYSFFVSARNDGSNLFGIKTNNKWSPFWSIGAGWDISKEHFYNVPLIPYLKLRASYGFNGNVYLGQSAYTTLNYLSATEVTNVPYATIRNAPNPDLRWEEVRTANFGLDLHLKANVLSLSIDYYKKRSSNVFGSKSLDPTTGLSVILANSADIEGSGMEVQMNSNNITRKDFNWKTSFQLNNSTYKLTKYLLQNQSRYGFVSNGQVIVEKVGYNPYAVVSYHWGGLDPQTGEPMGILNGRPTKNYDSLSRFTLNEDQVIHGSAVPTVYGNLLNTINWKNLSLSVNITYKFGYYFRKPALNYYNVLNLGQVSHDYVKRWQKPADELATDVPALIYPVSYEASYFYENTEINVGKGDHIRINDLRLGYDIASSRFKKLPFTNITLFFYTGLDLLIWKANKFGLDPDYPAGIIPSKSFALGLKITL